MCENESFISKVADKIVQNKQTKDKIKQDLYQSLSFDQDQLQDKYTALQNSYEQLKKSCNNLRKVYDALEQYGRRNCLIFHGIDDAFNKGVGKSTDNIIIDVVNDKLGITIHPSDLDRLHRLMRKIKSTKPRPIVVKFTSYNVKVEVYRQQRKLKGSGIVITESLTKTHLELYHIVSKHAV